MSHQDTQSQDSLNFLKTVVGEDSGQSKNGTDSDKENEHGSIITSTNEFQFDLSENSVKKQPMAEKDPDMWEDFYEDDFEQIADKDGSRNDFDALIGERTLEKVEEEEEENFVDESNATDTMDSNTKENSSENKPDSDGTDRSKKRKRKKKLFRRIRPPQSTSGTQPFGGSYPNLGPHDSENRNDSTEQHSNHLETMSDSSGGGRKLNRRKQVSRPRCAGPPQTGNRLEQKYQELEHLMLKPLTSPAVYVKQTRQQMLRLQGLSTQYHKSSHDACGSGLPPTGQRETGSANVITQYIEEDADQAYSTIRTVQVVNTVNRNNRPMSAHPRRRPTSGQRRNRPQSADQVRRVTTDNSETNSVLSNVNLNLSNSRGRARNGGGDLKKVRSDSNASGGSHKRSDRSNSGSKDRDYSSSFEDGTRSRSGSRSPGRVAVQTDTHLKNSSNPALRQWLKVKDKEFRKQKIEERKKKRKEREEKQEEELKKQELLTKAEEKVKEWMTQKRKEAWKLAKEERRRQKEVEKEMAERQETYRYNDSLRGRTFTPIQRPEGKHEAENKPSEQQQQQDNTTTTPQPPKSKFVYKRPVSGRVRLMKLQQERKDDSKKTEAKKKEMEKMLADEKERKMRMSYDQWLLKKREDDYAKRQVTAKQRALTKSDPELDRIVPQMARKRIENIRRGKKRIETGDSLINESVNNSFGGGDFGEEDKKENPSYRLEVSGDKKSLKQRPSSAKATSSGGMLNPKLSKSPRRPKSAHPRVQAVMDETQDSSADYSFKLPFQPELGVPKYVSAKQEKLFSGEVMANASMEAIDSKALPVEESKESHMIEGASGAVNGEDQVDAKAELQGERDIKTTENESNKGGQSFFVTDGNLDEGDELKDDNGLMENDDDDDDNVEDKEDIFVNTADDNSVDDTPNVQSTVVEDKSVSDIISGRNSDERQNGGEDDEGGNVVPPLEFGDDDADINYEEEKKDGEEEKMDFSDTTTCNEVKEQTAESNLLNNVEDSTSSRSQKGVMKHVSFSDEATIHEDPLAGISNDEDFFDEPDDRFERDEGNNDNDAEDPILGINRCESYDYDDEFDEIEGDQDWDDEAEDERGGYIDNETPRDDF